MILNANAEKLQARVPAIHGVVRGWLAALSLHFEPDLQILGGHPRPLLLRLEQAHGSAVENHVHRHRRMGLKFLSMRIGIGAI
jgi:hypothetical protein